MRIIKCWCKNPDLFNKAWNELFFFSNSSYAIWFSKDADNFFLNQRMFRRSDYLLTFLKILSTFSRINFACSSFNGQIDKKNSTIWSKKQEIAGRPGLEKPNPLPSTDGNKSKMRETNFFWKAQFKSFILRYNLPTFDKDWALTIFAIFDLFMFLKQESW